MRKIGLLLSFPLALVCPRTASAQQIRFDSGADGRADSGYSFRWDATQDRPIAFRDSSAPEIPAARVFGATDGKSVPVYPLKDVPGAVYIDVWSSAAAPSGGLALAGVIGYGPRGSKPSIKSVILIYDKNGALRKLWDVQPYHHHHVALDEVGNVYALGDRTDGQESYPLLIKYSTDGKVVGEFLSSSLFTSGDDVVGSGSRFGETQMFIKGRELLIWLAPTREMLRYSTEGTLLARTSFVPAMQKIEDSNAGATLQVLSLSVTPNHEVIAQGRLWPKDLTQRTSMGMLHFQSDGQLGAFVGTQKGQIERLFIGTTKDQKMVYRESSGVTTVFNIE